MSLRLPQSLPDGLAASGAFGALEAEVAAEKAAALGRAGRILAARLAALRDCDDAAARPALVRSAADAAYGFLVQRELIGLFDRRQVIEDHAIPPEVIARMGAVDRSR